VDSLKQRERRENEVREERKGGWEEVTIGVFLGREVEERSLSVDATGGRRKKG
jgi:hypothetical protein